MLHLSLLGGFKAYFRNRSFVINRYKLERALLAFLATENGKLHWRVELAELFWPDRPEGVARTNLRQVLAGLRKALRDRTRDIPYLFITTDTIQFNLDSDHWIDLADYQNKLDAVQNHTHESLLDCPICIQYLEDANGLYKGDFLEGPFLSKSIFFQEWVTVKREKLCRQEIQVLERLTHIHQYFNEPWKAVECLCKLLEIDPYHEPAYRQLMKIYALSGLTFEALHQYQNCREILACELGIQPSEATSELFENIRSGKFAKVGGGGDLPM